MGYIGLLRKLWMNVHEIFGTDRISNIRLDFGTDVNPKCQCMFVKFLGV